MDPTGAGIGTTDGAAGIGTMATRVARGTRDRRAIGTTAAVMGAMLAIASCGDDPPAVVPAFESPAWITDAQGRVLVLRGMNVDLGAKGGKAPDVRPEDARRMARDWGFGFVRLLMTWEAVMPREGEVDAAYLDALAQVVDTLWAEGVRVMLDMHQDVYARRFCCDGAPDWAVRDDGEPFEMQSQWFLNYFQPAVVRCFDNFWDADGPHADLQRQFAAAWKAVAARFRDHPGVVGYDLFNEPHPGSDLDVGELLGTPDPDGPHPAFDREKLFPMYQRVIDAIRTVDDRHWIMVEPRYGAPGNGLPSYHPALSDPRPGTPRLCYAPHLYSLDYEQYRRWDPSDNLSVQFWEAARNDELARQPMALLLGEWGFDWTFPGAADYGAAVMTMADRMRAGWAYWSYDPGSWGLFDSDGSERPAADAIVRPYPRAVAGLPIQWWFNPESRVFHLVFSGQDGASGATEIFVPAARHYPGGWTLTVSDPDGTWSSSFDADRGILSLETPRSALPHTVEIRPAPP